MHYKFQNLTGTSLSKDTFLVNFRQIFSQ